LGIAKWGTGKDKPVELEVPKTNEAMYHNTLLPSKKVTSRKGTDTFFDLDSYNASKIGLKRNMWRGYHIDFLRDQIGSKIVYSETLTESGDTYGRFYIWLPVHVNRKLKGYIRAQTTKPTNKKFPSYLNAPGSWSLTHGLFPFDPAIRLMKSLGLTTIILVEGPRDALRLIQAGIPAMSMLGTQSWSDQKTRLLEFAGVTRLVLFLDGDEAGKNATRFLTTGYRVKTDTAAAIKPLGDTFELKVLRLWNVEVPPGHPESSLDPGNVPDIYLNKLTRLLT
jgi:hypothetical protein